VLTPRINNALMADWPEMDHAWCYWHLREAQNFAPLPMPNGSPGGRPLVASLVGSQSSRALRSIKRWETDA